MAQRSGGLYRLLQSPAVYETLQAVMGGNKGRSEFAALHVRARPGDRVLDIGCGPGHLLGYLPDGVDYVGWEPNPRYVEHARRSFGRRGSLHLGLFTQEAARGLAPFDIVIVSAVLHHLGDGEARNLFGLLRGLLAPGGRVVSIDGVFAPGQNPLAKLLISLDRGRHMRSAEGYEALAAADFDRVEGRILHRRFPPYTHFVMTAARRATT